MTSPTCSGSASPPATGGAASARALLDRAVPRPTADGAERMLLEVAADNPGALAFYGAAGFVEIARRRRYYRGGADAVVLQLP